jgi:hypothetical protein
MCEAGVPQRAMTAARLLTRSFTSATL